MVKAKSTKSSATKKGGYDNLPTQDNIENLEGSEFDAIDIDDDVAYDVNAGR